jgi:hypothetical protein
MKKDGKIKLLGNEFTVSCKTKGWLCSEQFQQTYERYRACLIWATFARPSPPGPFSLV